MSTVMKNREALHKRTRKQAMIGAVYILPSFVLMLMFSIIPMFMALYYSFTKFNMAGAPEFIGFLNYQKLYTNRALHQALMNTVHYVLMTVPFQTVFALLIAVFLAERLKNSMGSFLRSVIFVPVIVSLISSATVWRILYSTNDGFLNQIIMALGAEKPVNFLGSKQYALLSVAIVAIWKNTGYFMVIYYAGVMNISSEIKEAAIVDGANARQRFFAITLPILKPITYMVLTLGLIWSFQVFDLVYKMTGGGPGRSTYTVAYVIYTYAFQDKRIGYACALAICLLLVILLIHFLQDQFFKEKEVK